MPICNTNCAGGLLSPNLDPCKPNYRAGGISHFILWKCCPTGITLEQLEDFTFWEDLVADCEVKITPKLRGSKSNDSFTKVRLSSCGSETTTGQTQTYEFASYDMDNELNSTIEWWNDFQLAADTRCISVVYCSGYATFPQKFGTEVSFLVPDNSKDYVSFAGNVTIDYFGQIPQFEIPTNPLNPNESVIDLLNANINSVCAPPLDTECDPQNPNPMLALFQTGPNGGYGYGAYTMPVSIASAVGVTQTPTPTANFRIRFDARCCDDDPLTATVVASVSSINGNTYEILGVPVTTLTPLPGAITYDGVTSSYGFNLNWELLTNTVSEATTDNFIFYVTLCGITTSFVFNLRYNS